MNVSTVTDVSGSVLTLISLSCDIVKTLHTLCGRFAQAKQRLNGLELQMLALRNALRQIQALAPDDDTEVQRHPLPSIPDLDICLTLCEGLLERLDRDLAGLSTDEALREPTFLARLKTAFHDGSETDMEALLDRQTNSIVLILMSYSCQTLRQQNELLQCSPISAVPHKSSSDSASLCGLVDTESVFSQGTDVLSKISHDFSFDTTLLSTKPYVKQSNSLVNLLKRRVQRDSPRFQSKRRVSFRPSKRDGIWNPFLVSQVKESWPEEENAVVRYWFRSERDSHSLLHGRDTFVTGTSATALQTLTDAEIRNGRRPSSFELWEQGIYLHEAYIAPARLLIARSTAAEKTFDESLLVYLMDLVNEKKEVHEWQRQLHKCMASRRAPRGQRCVFSVVLADDDSVALAHQLHHPEYDVGETSFFSAICHWDDFAAEQLDLVADLWHEALFDHISPLSPPSIGERKKTAKLRAYSTSNIKDEPQSIEIKREFDAKQESDGELDCGFGVVAV